MHVHIRRLLLTPALVSRAAGACKVTARHTMQAKAQTSFLEGRKLYQLGNF